jgi:predicted outer membrane repeat protein
VALLTGALHAEDPSLTVTIATDTTADDGQTSLREAVAYAISLSGPQVVAFSDSTTGGAVNFFDGASRTITLGSTLVITGRDVAIGGPGPNALTVSGAGLMRLFRVGTGARVALDGMTLAQGKLDNDSNSGGGAVLNSGGNLTLTNCRLSGNLTGANNIGGGALCNTAGGTMTVDGCTFSGNQSGTGNQGGGAIHCGSGVLMITDSTFQENLTGATNSGGGAIYAAGGTVTALRCTFAANHADNSNLGGGAFFCAGVGKLVNCTLSGNTATGSGTGGGAVLNSAASVTVTNTTVTGNVPNGIVNRNAGAFFAAMPLANSIVAGNGTDLALAGTAGGGFQSNGANFVGVAGAGVSLAAGDKTFASTGITLAQVLNPLLADNGGPTKTHALIPSSPAIDAGSNAAALEQIGVALTSDQRGRPRRLIGLPASATAIVDLGSCEFGEVPSSALTAWRALQGLPHDGSQDHLSRPNDGIANLLKFAFNMAPNSGGLNQPNLTTMPANGTAGLPRITTDAQGRLVLQFVRRSAASVSGVVYAPEVSANLNAWTLLDTAGATVQTIDAVWERVTVVDLFGNNRRFARVRVFTAPP